MLVLLFRVVPNPKPAASFPLRFMSNPALAVSAAEGLIHMAMVTALVFKLKGGSVTADAISPDAASSAVLGRR